MRLKIFFAFFLISIACCSQTNEIKKLESKRKTALREIENTNKLLLQTNKTAATLLDRIKLLSSQIESRQQVVKILNQEIVSITNEQADLEKEIAALEMKLKMRQADYAKAVQSMAYKKQSENKLLFVLSGKSLTELVRRMRYLREYSEWRKQQAKDLKQQQTDLKEKKVHLEKTKKNKLLLLMQRESEKSTLTKEQEVQKQEVSEATKKQTELTKILAVKQKQAKLLNNQIQKLIAEEVARQQRENKRIADQKARAAGKKPTTSSKTDNSNVSPEDLSLSSNFASNKGKLPMPVTGGYSIVGKFGTQNYSKFVKTNSDGIDIQAKAGANARAVFNGVVTRVIAFPGYNNCVIIRHGEYYTFYGNIQTLSVKQGEKVTTGQNIGSVYTDTDTGNAELHFQLWKGTNKLDPSPWLRR